MEKLSIEKQFALCKLSIQIKSLDRDQLECFFVEMYRQFLAREQMYQEIMKENLFK